MQKKWKMFFFLIIILTLSLSYCSYSFSFSGPFTVRLEPLNSQIREKRLKMTPSFTQHLLLIWLGIRRPVFFLSIILLSMLSCLILCIQAWNSETAPGRFAWHFCGYFPTILFSVSTLTWALTSTLGIIHASAISAAHSSCQDYLGQSLHFSNLNIFPLHRLHFCSVWSLRSLCFPSTCCLNPEPVSRDWKFPFGPDQSSSGAAWSLLVPPQTASSSSAGRRGLLGKTPPETLSFLCSTSSVPCAPSRSPFHHLLIIFLNSQSAQFSLIPPLLCSHEQAVGVLPWMLLHSFVF